ncbi:hypothetical protein CAMSH0001_0227 [Campylobacter showae RM3277]|uniref:Uncharacterized protein n=1 Tax=Campylobacter showae RM3277 TaxID=553219 RepID=C6RI75_9BACT|nr:hypothetical protein CAMSH0001_0227 [Campylobacter showae RM3277]
MSRECFSEILQNFRSAGYMPSARSILLQNSKNHLAILRLIVLCSNLSHRDLHLKNAKLKPAHSAATYNVQWGWWGFGGGRGDAS